MVIYGGHMFYLEEEQTWRGAILMHVKSSSGEQAISEFDIVSENPFVFQSIGQLDYMWGNRMFLTLRGCVNRNVISAFIEHPTHWIGGKD